MRRPKNLSLGYVEAVVDIIVASFGEPYRRREFDNVTVVIPKCRLSNLFWLRHGLPFLSTHDGVLSKAVSDALVQRGEVDVEPQSIGWITAKWSEGNCRFFDANKRDITKEVDRKFHSEKAKALLSENAPVEGDWWAVMEVVTTNQIVFRPNMETTSIAVKCPCPLEYDSYRLLNKALWRNTNFLKDRFSRQISRQLGSPKWMFVKSVKFVDSKGNDISDYVRRKVNKDRAEKALGEVQKARIAIDRAIAESDDDVLIQGPTFARCDVKVSTTRLGDVTNELEFQVVVECPTITTKIYHDLEVYNEKERKPHMYWWRRPLYAWFVIPEVVIRRVHEDVLERIKNLASSEGKDIHVSFIKIAKARFENDRGEDVTDQLNKAYFRSKASQALGEGRRSSLVIDKSMSQGFRLECH